MKIEKTKFGNLWGQDTYLYTLENDNQIVAKINDYGATLKNLYVPDKNGVCKDIVLGFGDFYASIQSNPFMGVIVGRFANRIKNGRFTLNGKEYQLPVQATTGNHIHGGVRGFDKYIWQATTKQTADSVSLILQHHSPNGDENYPGALDVKATYTLRNDNNLILEMEAVCDQDTIINLVNHSYFNLAGHENGSLHTHTIQIDSNQILEADEKRIPTGKILPIEETTLDCRTPIAMKDLFAKQQNNGVDNCFVLDNPKREVKKVATVIEEESSRIMDLYTDNVGVQFYNAPGLGAAKLQGKDGVQYGNCAGFCLETQHFPNSPNQPSFPSCVLKKGEVYKHTWQLAFRTQ